jgi:putative transposase
MPRRPRDEEEGAIHHVYARGNNRAVLFIDDADRIAYLALIGRAVGHCEWLCLAYCLMGTHVHLLVETPRPNLAEGMQRAHGRYAELFNQRHARVGHVFQGRYGAVRVRTDAQLYAVAEYIDRNPVEAGIAVAPTHWLWGSTGAIAHQRQPAWLAERRLTELRTNAACSDARRRHPLAGQRLADIAG